MMTTTTTIRPVRLAWALALALSLLLVPMAGEATAKPTGKEVRMTGIVNRVRGDHGLRALKLNRKMNKRAHQHSVAMANSGSIWHSSCLSCHSPKPHFSRMGENVAKAQGVKAAHRNLMRSPGHRANILCGCYKQVGIGIVKRGKWVYVTQIFWG